MKNKNKHKVHNEFNIDQILEKNNLNYSDINFERQELDIIKSYHSLNRKIHSKPDLLRNIHIILSEINFKPILKPLYSIVLTSIVILTILFLNNTTEQLQFTKVTVNKGEKVTLHVSDNMIIYLNSGSSIRVPLKIKRNSKIYIEGEAYFKLSNNKKITVIAKGLNFTAKNSNFHINTNFNNQLVAHVKNGNVKLYNPDLPKSTELLLNINDKVVYNSTANFIAVEKETSTNYLAWHTGKINFQQTPMYKVSQTLTNLFQIPIVINNQNINESRFNANFQNADIDEILDKIQLTFNCEISGDGSKIIIN